MNARPWIRFLTCFVALGAMFTLPRARIAEAQTCSCEVCFCYRTHPVTQTCTMPALEPCDCWECPS